MLIYTSLPKTRRKQLHCRLFFDETIFVSNHEFIFNRIYLLLYLIISTDLSLRLNEIKSNIDAKMSFYTLHLVSLLFILLHLLCFIQLKNSFLTHSFGNQRRHIISKNIKNKISTTLLTAKFKKSSNTKRSLDFDAVDDENESDDDVESFDDDNITIEQIDQVTEKPRTTSTKPKSKTTQTTKSQASRSKTSSTNDDSKTTTSSTPSITPAWRETVESDIRSIITSTGDITILKLHIVQNRIELTVSNGAHDNEAIKQLSAEDLRSIHRQLYTAFELKEEELAVVTRFEVYSYIH